MREELKRAFNKEFQKGKNQYYLNKLDSSFYHFERAHILGQPYVVPHTKVHFWMLLVGIKTKNSKEILGQLIRIPAGIMGSFFGIVPSGNTGGSNVSILKPMPIPDDLKIKVRSKFE